MNRKKSFTWVYLIPGLLLMTVFVTVPVALSVVMSFFEIRSLSMAWRFVGFENYVRAFATSGMMNAFGRTVLYGAVGLLIGLVFGLILAFFVSKHRMLGFYRYVFYLPGIVSAITMGRLWNYVLTPTDYGFANILFRSLGLIDRPINFLGDQTALTWTILVMNFYGAGGGMTLILYTTAINNIDECIIESARIEGASAGQIAFGIQLPLIKPIVVTNLILGVIGAFKSFEGMYALAPNAEATETIAVLLYKESIGSAYGYGSPASMGILLTLIVMTIMAVYLKLPSKGDA